MDSKEPLAALDDDDVPGEIWERRAAALWRNSPKPKRSARWPHEPPAPPHPGADSSVPSRPSPAPPGLLAAQADPTEQDTDAG
jgi:hypothetical protein